MAQPATYWWCNPRRLRLVRADTSQARERGTLPRAVRTAWPVAIQSDAQRSRRRSPIRVELPRMQRGADGSDGADRHVRSRLDDRTSRGRLGLQARPRPNATLDVGTVHRDGRPRRPLRRERVIPAGVALRREPIVGTNLTDIGSAAWTGITLSRNRLS